MEHMARFLTQSSSYTSSSEQEAFVFAINPNGRILAERWSRLSFRLQEKSGSDVSQGANAAMEAARCPATGDTRLSKIPPPPASQVIGYNWFMSTDVAAVIDGLSFVADASISKNLTKEDV
jgi:hypothetical protein